MLITHETKDVTIRVRLPRIGCEGCGEVCEPPIGEIVQLIMRDGAYEPVSVFRPAGWNCFTLPEQPPLDLCPKCTARAVLERRRESEKPQSAPIDLPLAAPPVPSDGVQATASS